ncbi:MAG: hypothetical protein LC774_06970, partial [Acidobacteria bacterium]|nr:hypothetical protein [Acidobacteriota bacterium]
MLKGNLKSLALLCGVTALAASLLVLSLGGFLALTSYGLILCAALLRRMAGSSFDPHVVDTFVGNIDFFDNLIADQDIQEQVAS